ncbi:hypothetical protein FRC07_010844 [Ceratobasidium sp. 392]|nr:hypothetical protein FRC07_010844 [Ceratobasidium sp. 392]
MSTRLAPINSLPSEVLHMILSLASRQWVNEDYTYVGNLEETSITKLSSVCSMWRSLMLRSHTFWTDIELLLASPSTKGRYQLAELWADRSRGAPLDVYISESELVSVPGRDLASWNISDIAGFLAPLMPRVRALKVHSQSSSADTLIRALIAGWIQHGCIGRAEVLEICVDEELDVVELPGEENDEITQNNLTTFFGSLRTLRLQNTLIDRSFAIHSGLVELWLESIGNWYPTQVEIVGILAASPRIRLLTLINLDIREPLISMPNPVALNELEVLTLEAAYPEYLWASGLVTTAAGGVLSDVSDGDVEVGDPGDPLGITAHPQALAPLARCNMTRLASRYFTHLSSGPNPDTHTKLWEHRCRQRRPITQSPFVPEDSLPLSSRASSLSSTEVQQGNAGASSPGHLDIPYGDQPPFWLSLFYDLAWTATFASLVENSQFRKPRDTGSYVVFFTTVWWMWVSHVLYTVEYYSDDWLHLLATFAQLLIFGIIAATTKDFDVTAFIEHRPGSGNLKSDNVQTITIDEYQARKLAFNSIKVITVAIAASRLEQAPGFITANGGNIFCCALIIFLLAYLYFEGPTPLKPSFLTSIDAGIQNLDSVTNDTSQDPSTFETRLREALLKGGLSYDIEWPKLENMWKQNGTAQNNSEAASQLGNVWAFRESLQISLNMFANFMDNNTIPDSTWGTIDRYMNDYNFTVQDTFVPPGQQPILSGIYNDLVTPSITDGRYIMALCGGTLVSLATLNLIHSWPRDKFVWGSILSKYAIGTIMIFLLLFNIGHDQSYFPVEGAKATFLNWIGHAWAIGTLAIAYFVQFAIDTVLLYLSVRYSKKELASTRRENAAMTDRPHVQSPRTSSVA